MTQMRGGGLQEPLLYGRTVPESTAVRNRRLCYITIATKCVIGLFIIGIISIGLSVVLPRFMAKEIQNAEFQVESISISSPTENGFIIAIDATLSVSNGTLIYTKPALVQLIYKNSTITEIAMDGMEMSGPVSIHLKGATRVHDEDGFAALTRDLIASQTIEIGFRSTLDVIPYYFPLGNLTVCSVVMDKTIALTGFGGIKPSIQNVSVSGVADSSFELNVTFDVDNPTIFSLHPLGVLSFDLFSDSVRIGQAISGRSWSMDSGLNRGFDVLGKISPTTPKEVEAVISIIEDFASLKEVFLTAVTTPPYSSESLYAKGLANMTVNFGISGVLFGKGNIE